MSEIILIAGVTMAGAGQYQQGQALKSQSESEAAILEYNAFVAEREAEGARMAAREEAEEFSREAERFKARQRALYGKSGVEFRGTPLTVLNEQATLLELDRLSILREGSISAARLKSQAGAYRMGAKSAKQRGRSAARGAALSAVGTLLTGYGMASQYSVPKTAGPSKWTKKMNTKAQSWLG
jgi:hypothetical protein